jgi:hypothetical protein
MCKKGKNKSRYRAWREIESQVKKANGSAVSK